MSNKIEYHSYAYIIYYDVYQINFKLKILLKLILKIANYGKS